MMNKLSDYDFKLPEALIAQFPTSPRDHLKKGYFNTIVHLLLLCLFLISFSNKTWAVDDTVLQSNIIFSEVMPTNYKVGEEKKEEFIELYNQSDLELNLDGWHLSDKKGKTSSYFFTSLIIKPKEYIFLTYSQTKVRLNDDGDGVLLIDNLGNTIDQVDFGRAKSNQSYSLINNIWQWSPIITPGALNELPAEEADKETIPLKVFTIIEARNEQDGKEVVIEGIVTANPGSISENYFYIQDETGGLQIYSYYKNFPALEAGDKIKVTGELSTTNEERRLKIRSAEDIKPLGKMELPSPRDIKINEINEGKEGGYIKVVGKVTESSGSQFTLSDDSGEIKILIKQPRVDKPKLKKGDNIEVSGIVSQYKSYYRILPFLPQSVKIMTLKDLPIAGPDNFIYIIISLFIFGLWNTFLKTKLKLLRLQKNLPRNQMAATFLLYLAIWGAAKPHLLKDLQEL